ncbi:multiprotein bridging factor aMBF1 [Candidatus Altiarchaeota archaeon]
MMCEICGRQTSKGFKIKIEGGQATACGNCASHGEVIGKVVPGQKKQDHAPRKPQEVGFDIETGKELVEDYQGIIKRAREKRGLRQDELARMINEPSSLIHRIESGRKPPSPKVAGKLERKLDITLLKASEEAGDVKTGGKRTGPLTLGDMVVIKNKK